MALDYASIAKDAADALAEVGVVVTIARDTRTTDPVTGAVSGPAPTTGTFTVVNPPAFTGTTKPFDNQYMGDGALITDDMRFLVVAAHNAPFEPAAGDVVTMGGRDHKVLGVTPVSPAGTPLVYRLGMRA